MRFSLKMVISIQRGENCKNHFRMCLYTVYDRSLLVFTQISHSELIMMISLCQIQKWITFRQILPKNNHLAIYRSINTAIRKERPPDTQYVLLFHFILQILGIL